jgi:hypothetical protein
MTGPDLYQLFAATQGVPEGWRWYSLNAVGESRTQGGVLITGAVCTETITRGLRKGEPNWKKRDRATERELFATFSQLDAVRDQWERDTGKCASCGGDGQESAGWIRRTGTLYRPCTRCNATGKAPSQSAGVAP